MGVKKRKRQGEKGNAFLIFIFLHTSMTHYHLSFISTLEGKKRLMEMRVPSLSVLSGLTVGVLREVPVNLMG